MLRQCIAIAVFVIATACGGCTQAPAYKIHKLSSGRQVKVITVGRMYNPGSRPVLILRYQTDIAIADTVDLQREAADIWHDFQAVADSERVRSAVLSANSAPSGGLVSTVHGYNFEYKKAPNGRWHRD